MACSINILQLISSVKKKGLPMYFEQQVLLENINPLDLIRSFHDFKLIELIDQKT